MRVCVVLTARASYAKLQTTIAALLARGVDVQLIACASALLERYGRVVSVVRDDFPTLPIEEVYSVVEGETLETSAIETGALFSALARTYARLKPDVVLVMADRHEVLAAAGAAKYQHITLGHCQGGERSGSVDDRVRDAITQLADWHFVCTRISQMRVYSLTGDESRVRWVGCGSIDLAKQAMTEPPVTAAELGGAGAPIDLAQPFIVVLQHPVTSEADEAYEQMGQTMVACINMMPVRVLVLWPGEDAGAAGASKAIRESAVPLGLHTLRNLPPSRFLRLLTQCACLIGNSSAGIREASYLGVPVVNIGTRQHGRERGPNVIDVPHDALQIRAAIEQQIAHGRYPSSPLYGSGNAGQRIAEVICEQCVSDHSRTVRQ